MSLCLIGLGSNLGDRRAALDEAAARLGRHPHVRLVAASPWLETRPAGGPPGQPPYLNGAAVLETSLRPDALLEVLQQIEGELGRQRPERWAPRTIDLDLLLYDELVWNTASLVLPHPRMAWRRFVLEPAAMVAGDMIHPQTGWTIRQLLDHLDTSPCYVAICGVVGSEKELVAALAAKRSGGHWLTGPRTREDAIEWLDVIASELKADRPKWRRKNLVTVSDFWLGASVAAARLTLSPVAWDAYRTGWEQIRAGLVRPRLIVVLETPADVALRRIRGRPGGLAWTAERIGRTAAAILAAALQPGQGPLLRLGDTDIEAAVAETSAALEAMK